MVNEKKKRCKRKSNVNYRENKKELTTEDKRSTLIKNEDKKKKRTSKRK